MGRGGWGQVGACRQRFILKIPSEHRCCVALDVWYLVVSHPHAACIPGLSPCSGQKAAPMPWDQAEFFLCLLGTAGRFPAHVVPGTPTGLGICSMAPFFLAHYTVTHDRCSTSSRSGEGAGLTGGWRRCRAGPAMWGDQTQFGMEGGTGAGGQSPAVAPWHPAGTGAPCKALSWQAALFSSGDTGTKSCSPSQRLPLPPGTTTASQPG